MEARLTWLAAFALARIALPAIDWLGHGVARGAHAVARDLGSAAMTLGELFVSLVSV